MRVLAGPGMGSNWATTSARSLTSPWTCKIPYHFPTTEVRQHVLAVIRLKGIQDTLHTNNIMTATISVFEHRIHFQTPQQIHVLAHSLTFTLSDRIHIRLRKPRLYFCTFNKRVFMPHFSIGRPNQAKRRSAWLTTGIVLVPRCGYLV